jgi:hypothetical protein
VPAAYCGGFTDCVLSHENKSVSPPRLAAGFSGAGAARCSLIANFFTTYAEAGAGGGYLSRAPAYITNDYNCLLFRPQGKLHTPPAGLPARAAVRRTK